MAQVQRVQIPGGELSWTVVGGDHSVIVPAEEYLEYARQTGLRRNTVRSYAQGLAEWWSFLENVERGWDRVSIADVVEFIGRLRAPDRRRGSLSDGSVQARVRAVTSCYRYHAALGRPTLVVETSTSRGGYVPFLGHLRRQPQFLAAVVVRRRRTIAPVLTPAQIQELLEAEAVTIDGDWTGDVRYRLLWALLADTGMRIGEALGLQHRDWAAGRGGTAAVTIADRSNPHGVAAKSGPRVVHVGSRLDRLYSDYVWWLCDRGADQEIEDWNSSYVFCNISRGQRWAPLRLESIYAHLAVVKRRAPLVPSEMTPHWFRHTHATALLLTGTPVHVVSRRLGHKDVQTTLNTYGHVTEDAELAALANWAEFSEGWWGADD